MSHRAPMDVDEILSKLGSTIGQDAGEDEAPAQAGAASPPAQEWTVRADDIAGPRPGRRRKLPRSDLDLRAEPGIEVNVHGYYVDILRRLEEQSAAISAVFEASREKADRVLPPDARRRWER